ncbi:MAG: STAS domain-containing protein [Gemmatimonadaceae bacterium]|nr:STAS domain-containing protein [Acetobacteraceae bacterium]
MIALLEAERAGLFQRRHWLPNLVSGVIVGVVALPLALAFAIASGVRPEQGIYTSIIAGLIVSIFGGSRVQIAGPTGAFIVILAAVVAAHGVDGLLLATIMAGLMLTALGLARFGGVIRFIPAPVIVGFTAGIGVIIFVGQWRDFFGLPKTGGVHFHEKLWQLIQVLPQLDPTTTALSILSLGALIYAPRVQGLRHIPGPVIALVLATMIQAVFGFTTVATIGSAFGAIPQGLPGFVMPDVSLDRLIALLPAAFTIAMLGAIESLLSAVVADGMSDTRHNSNQELIGQGLANIVTPFFGGIAATGAMARTATNVRNGATGPLSGIVHAAVLVLVLLVLAPLAGRIPLAALAAILFVVAWTMSDVPHFVRMARTAPVADTVILLITFALTILTDLVIAVNIGVILAMLQFLRRMAGSVAVQTTVADGVMVVGIAGPLFFGAADNLDRALAGVQARAVVVRLGQVPFVDATGLQALGQAIRLLDRRGIPVLLCEANPIVLRKLLRAGLVRHGRTRRYFSALSMAMTKAGAKAKTAGA